MDDLDSTPRRHHAVRLYWTLTLWLVGALAPGSMNAQPSPPPLRLSEYQRQDWQVEDGLPENNIRSIGQRPDGVLMLATSSGLASFDGQRFQSIPAYANDGADHEAVNSFLYDRRGDLWIGTDGRGVLRRSGANVLNVSEQAGHLNERVRMLYEDASRAIWIATQNGVERFADGRLDVVAGVGMISGDITAPFANDGRGGVFFITSSGLFHWREGKAELFLMRNKEVGAPTAVYSDSRGRVWVGGMRGLLELVPGANKEEFSSVLRGRLPGAVTTLLADKSGNLWIGTRRDGLWRLAADGLTSWTSRNGLPDDSIRSLYLDDEENLWIGMLSGGLSRWRKAALASYGPPEGFPATFFANTFADSRGDLWLGTWGRGLFRLRNGHLAEVNPPGMPLTTPIRAFAEDRDGHIWVGTWFDGVYRWDGRRYTHFLLGVESPGNAVSALLPDKRGALWVGTYTGLFVFPDGKPTLGGTLLLKSQLITCLLEDGDGSILVGTSRGLYRVEGRTVTPVSGLPHPYVLSLTRDSRGSVWAGTKAGGLALVGHVEAKALPVGSGLPALPVNTAVEDRDGHLWLGTSRGLVRVAVDDLHNVIEGRGNQLSTMLLDKADGMRSSECGGVSKPTSTRMPDGTLWFATAKGFVHTTDVAEKIGDAHPTASITGWTLSSDPAVPQPSTGPRVDLEPGQPDVLFFFNAKLLANPAHVEYRYRLREYDTDWTSTRAHSVRYRRLPAGDFTFEVQARSSGEAWSSPLAALPVRQKPFFYERWIFYVALAFLAGALAVYLFRRRVQTIKGRIGLVLEERNRIARECHDTLMAGFAAISWQLEATSKLFRDRNSLESPEGQSCELARSMVAHCQAEARRIIWDLRDTEEVTSLLSQAMSRTLRENLRPEQIATTLAVEGEELPLAPGCIHQLVCIGQEAVANAVQHAAPTAIAIRLRYEADAVSLSIRDDGRGFQRERQAVSSRGHFGIAVMEERARKLGGVLRVQSEAGTGTEVMVRVSFHAMRQPSGDGAFKTEFP